MPSKLAERYQNVKSNSLVMPARATASSPQRTLTSSSGTPSTQSLYQDRQKAINTLNTNSTPIGQSDAFNYLAERVGGFAPQIAERRGLLTQAKNGLSQGILDYTNNLQADPKSQASPLTMLNSLIQNQNNLRGSAGVVGDQIDSAKGRLSDIANSSLGMLAQENARQKDYLNIINQDYQGELANDRQIGSENRSRDFTTQQNQIERDFQKQNQETQQQYQDRIRSETRQQALADLLDNRTYNEKITASDRAYQQSQANRSGGGGGGRSSAGGAGSLISSLFGGGFAPTLPQANQPQEFSFDDGKSPYAGTVLEEILARNNLGNQPRQPQIQQQQPQQPQQNYTQQFLDTLYNNGSQFYDWMSDTVFGY